MDYSYEANIPIYLQIMDLLKRQIVSGERKMGDRLESVRELAVQFCVNPNTMQRALSELEREGFVYAQRTSGRFITEDEQLIERQRKQMAEKYLHDFLKNMERLGYDKAQVIQMIERESEGE